MSAGMTRRLLSCGLLGFACGLMIGSWPLSLGAAVLGCIVVNLLCDLIEAVQR